MSKLILWNLITLDGFFEGERPWSLDWHQSVFDAELERFCLEQLQSAGMLLFGRVTYEGMAAHWQTATGEIADFMNRLPKAVFSRTLGKAEWNNTQLFKDDVPANVRDLKRRAEGNIFVFGSADLSTTLMEHGLFDEIRVAIAPVVLGTGKPLFGRNQSRRTLKLLAERRLSSGCLILSYQPV